MRMPGRERCDALAAIVSRLDVLPAPHRAVLGAASVLGRVFPAALLARISAPECQSDFDETVESLAFMEAADISKQRGGAAVKLSEVPR